MPEIAWSEVESLRAKVPALRDGLLQVLPTTMVPSLYIPVVYIPLSSSDKTNRKGLRQMIKNLSPSEIGPLQKSEAVKRSSRLLIDAEQAIHELWVDVLGRDCNTIEAEDSFMQLGVDSVSSIKVVGLAPAGGISITAGIVLANPRLCDMALKAT